MELWYRNLERKKIGAGLGANFRRRFLDCVSSALGCRAIVDDVGDHAMPQHSVVWSPDKLCWAHVILSRCAQTIQILHSLVPLALQPYRYMYILPVTTKFSRPCLLVTGVSNQNQIDKSSWRWRIVLISARLCPCVLLSGLVTIPRCTFPRRSIPRRTCAARYWAEWHPMK